MAHNIGSLTLSSLSASAPLVLEFNYKPRYVGLICTVSPGASLNYTVQVTGDSVKTPIVNWNSHDVLLSQTGSANGNIFYPVTAVRINMNSWSSGSVVMSAVIW